MRTAKELLILMLDNMIFFRSGLCALAENLYLNDIINGEEYRSLRDLIKSNKPERTYDEEWYWKPGIKKPRVNWIKKQIETL